MDTPEDKHRIEELKKALYSRQGAPELQHRPITRSRTTEVAETFEPIPEEEEVAAPTNPNLFKRIFIFSIIFFVIAAGIATYLFLNNSNTISAKNIVISIISPKSVGAGEELDLDINVSNKNTVDLQLVDLIIQYPDGTRTVGDKPSDLPRETISIGDLKSGETVQKSVKAVFFGEQGEAKQVKVSIQYRLANSNAVFQTNKTIEIAIGSSPVSLRIESLKEINSGQDISLKAIVTSNSPTLVKGLLLKLEAPFGFQFISATPAPIATQNTWSIGDLQPGEKREITINGKIIGQDNEERVFRFYTGTAKGDDEKVIGTIFINTSQSIVVKKPFIAVELRVDDSLIDPYVNLDGRAMRGELTLENNLATSVTDAVIELRITGSVIDETSINGGGAFYSSVNDTLIWSKETRDNLVEIKPGESQKLNFQFATIPLFGPEGATVKNPKLDLEITVKGKRYSEANVPEEIKTTLTRGVKIAANPKVETLLAHNADDAGSLPPKVDTPVVYTMTMKATNTLNDVKNAYVTAKLPQYVTYIKNVFPADAAVTYNSSSREFRWDVGSLPAGTGYSSDAKEITFDVSLLPSISQVGTEPRILTDIVISGGDSFTGKQITTKAQLITTRLKNDPDPSFKSGEVTNK